MGDNSNLPALPVNQFQIASQLSSIYFSLALCPSVTEGGVKEGHFEPWTQDLRPLEGTWAGPGQDLRLREGVF